MLKITKRAKQRKQGSYRRIKEKQIKIGEKHIAKAKPTMHNKSIPKA